MEEKQIALDEVTKKLAEIAEIEKTQALLKTNVNEFLAKDKLYRVHMPNAFEKDEMNRERMKKYIDFLNDDAYLFRKQLSLKLKKKGVDIAAMDKESERLYSTEKDLLRRLALASFEDDIKILKAKIEDIRLEAHNLFLDKEEKLRYCIESQLENFVRFYLIYLVLEVKNGDIWERLYKTYEDFQKADDDLIIGRAAQILASLVYNVKL